MFILKIHEETNFYPEENQKAILYGRQPDTRDYVYMNSSSVELSDSHGMRKRGYQYRTLAF